MTLSKYNTIKMSLYLYFPNEELRAMMRKHAEDRRPTDSGFDLMCPEQVVPFSQGLMAQRIGTGVHCAALNEAGEPAPYLLLARSSTSMTPLRMSNQIGLADMGYRGELFARVDRIDDKHGKFADYEIEMGRRLFQIVQHNWLPWKNVYIVDSMDELPAAPDNRGHGGLGSTGK